MTWYSRLAVVLVVFALIGCAQGVGAEGQARYSPENNGNMHDSGEGGSGGGRT